MQIDWFFYALYSNIFHTNFIMKRNYHTVLLYYKMCIRDRIDSLPDSMIGLLELHEAGFYSESMLPLTRERAVEQHDEGVTVYRPVSYTHLFKEAAVIQTSDMLNLPVPEAEYINEVL